jgi:hypothetical protein
MQERINKRLRPSNDLKNADVVLHQGNSPTRTHTSIHQSGNHVNLPVQPASEGEKR